MAEVTGFTAARMLAMEDATVIDARLDGYDLILITKDATEINVGDVRGPIGPVGPAVTALDDVGDVNVPAPNDRAMLAYDLATGEWAPVDAFVRKYATSQDVSNEWLNPSPTAGAIAVLTADKEIRWYTGDIWQHIAVALPADIWRPDMVSAGDFGFMGSMGAYRTGLWSNGYRDSSGQWKSLMSNGNTGAAFIDLDPTGAVFVGAVDSKVSGGYGINPTISVKNGSIWMGPVAASMSAANVFTSPGALIASTGTYISKIWASRLTPNAYWKRAISGDAADVGAWFLQCMRGETFIGGISQSGTTGLNFNTGSDHRLKDDLGPITNAIDRLRALKPKKFRWKMDGKEDEGFFAHEAQEQVPGAVTGKKDEVVLPGDVDEENGIAEGDPVYQSMDYGKVTPLITAALQEALDKIDALEARIAVLEGA